MVYTLQQYEYEMNRPFDGTMRILPSKCQAHALQIEMQKKREETKLLQLKQAEEHRQHIKDRDAILREILQQLQAVTNPAPISSPILPKPPDPPDLDPSDLMSAIRAIPEITKAPSLSNKLFWKYSCEELNQRMDNGLCIFCDEIDTHGHHLEKHKQSKILMVEYNDEQISSAMELVESVVEVVESDLLIQEAESPGAEEMIVTNKAESMEDKEEVSVTGSICVNDMIDVDMSQDEVSNPEKESSQGVLLQIQTPMYHQVLISATEQMRNKRFQSHIGMGFSEFQLLAPQMLVDIKEWVPLSLKPTFYLHIGEENKATGRYEQANHVWKPGGLSSTQAHWYCLQKTLEMFVQLVKETQDWQIDKRFDLEVFSGLDQETWTALELYGWENRKQMILLADKSADTMFSLKSERIPLQHTGATQIERYGVLSQKICIDVRRVAEHGRANRVWDCGGSHGAELNEHESLLEAAMDSTTARIHEHVKKDDNHGERSKLKDMEACVKKEGNGFLGDDTIILAFTMETRVAGDFFLFDSGIFKNSGPLYEKENSVFVGLGASYYALSYEHADIIFHKKHKWRSKQLQADSDFWTKHSPNFAELVLKTLVADMNRKEESNPEPAFRPNNYSHQSEEFPSSVQGIEDMSGENVNYIQRVKGNVGFGERKSTGSFIRSLCWGEHEPPCISASVRATNLRQRVQKIIFQGIAQELSHVEWLEQSKQRTWNMLFLHRATTDLGHFLLTDLNNLHIHINKNMLQVQVQHIKELALRLIYGSLLRPPDILSEAGCYYGSHCGWDNTIDDTASTSTEEVRSTCKPLLVVSILNLVVEHKFPHVLVHFRRTMNSSHAVDESHGQMLKHSFPQVKLLVYHFDKSCSKAGYRIDSTSVGDKNMNAIHSLSNTSTYLMLMLSRKGSDDFGMLNQPVQAMVQEARHLQKIEMVKEHKKDDIRFLVQWKEHPPDQDLCSFSSLRTSMLSTREYCDRNTLVYLIYSGLWYGLFQLIGLVISFYNLGQFV